MKDIPDEKLVYIDETGIETQLYRQYVRRSQGKRINMRISSKRRTRIALVAGQCKGKFVAPFTYGGTMKTPLFEQWFKDNLLKALPEGRVIIMDNASFHKKELLHKIAKEHSQTLIFLPPYSPH